MNTLKYFENYNLSLTQRLGKMAILGQPPGPPEVEFAGLVGLL